MNRVVIFLLLTCSAIYGQEPIKEGEGNFALPISQQPTPLVSFGQKNVDAGQMQAYLFADYFQGRKKTTQEIAPSIIYGITSNLSVFINAPFATRLKDSPAHSKGIEDVLVEFEYAYFNKTTKTAVDQATIVAHMTFPTGSKNKNPPTGFGAPSYFIGGTFNHMTTSWFAFTSHGGVFTQARHGTKFGNQFLYQCGYGYNIPSPKEWLYAVMAEVDGTYSVKDKIQGIRDPNSGGNTIFLTPSFWASSQRIILQLGVGVPIVQHLFGNQRKNHYSLVLNIGYTF